MASALPGNFKACRELSYPLGSGPSNFKNCIPAPKERKSPNSEICLPLPILLLFWGGRPTPRPHTLHLNSGRRETGQHLANTAQERSLLHRGRVRISVRRVARLELSRFSMFQYLSARTGMVTRGHPIPWSPDPRDLFVHIRRYTGVVTTMVNGAGV